MKRIFAWGDSPTAGTGFGNVNLHVLKALVNSGNYEVEQLGINDPCGVVDVTPQWPVSAARAADPNEPLGKKNFIERVRNGNFDCIWISNDPFMVAPVAGELQTILNDFRRSGKKVPKIVFYYTVDCQLRPIEGQMVELADRIVATSEFGKYCTVQSYPQLAKRVQIIPIGVDLATFFPLPPEIRQAIRAQHFNAAADSTFMFINVNRNSPRKQIPLTILAFAEFHRRHPDSRLYLHTQLLDARFALDLRLAAADLKLTPKEVIVPVQHSPKPVPAETLNKCYNAADAFITTSLGEGWGMTHFEAMAAGLPVVCPANSVFPEQLENGKAGYLYPCRERAWVENSGYRPYPRMEDILSAMEEVYADVTACRREGRSVADLPRVKAAARRIQAVRWQDITPRWVALFEELLRPAG